MGSLKTMNRLERQWGGVAGESYTTAWVALVPDVDTPDRPAWPQALTYVRGQQLPDGGWGDGAVYYAHDRTLSTLIAMRALLEWGDPADEDRIARGVAALHQYAPDLDSERHESIGFELLLPRLAGELERFNLDLPEHAWSHVHQMTAAKLALTGGLEPDHERPRSWWFSMEILPETQLAQIDERVLNGHGAIAISPAATAAYLRALRRRGKDSPRAAAYLAQVLKVSQGGAGHLWPVDAFELAWTIDGYMRAGLDPAHPRVAPLLRKLVDYWEASPTGLAHSTAFPINDGDDTAVGYKVLRWAGLEPADAPLLAFWDSNHYLTYPDERDASVSSNVHALLALRHDENNEQHKQLVIQITEWLRQQMNGRQQLHDKWHFSPFYATSRAIQALAGWDDDLAQQCVDFLLAHQDENGGWGWSGRPTLEETGYAILGLVAARRAGLLKNDRPLRLAAAYFRRPGRSDQRLWIGKVLYQPAGVVQAGLDAACLALNLQGI